MMTIQERHGRFAVVRQDDDDPRRFYAALPRADRARTGCAEAYGSLAEVWDFVPKFRTRVAAERALGFRPEIPSQGRR